MDSAVVVYGVVSRVTDSAAELFVRREDAEKVVEDWGKDEPVQSASCT